MFPALNLDVTVGEDDLQISIIQAKGEDSLPLNPDRDSDKEKDISDHCDNTLEKDSVNDYGCHGQQRIEFDYNHINQAPVPGDDQMELEMNSVLVIPQNVLLENDFDSDKDKLRLVDFTQPEHGALAFDNRKNLIYRAKDGYTGTDSFSYTITDGQGAVAKAMVKLSVTVTSDMYLTRTKYVNYIYNKSKLTPGSQSKINEIVARLRDLSYDEIEILAYTDNIGSTNYNLALSERRAEATRELLISMGIDENKIKALGMGEQNPIADNATQEGQAINRRGELRIKLGSSAIDQTHVLLKREENLR